MKLALIHPRGNSDQYKPERVDHSGICHYANSSIGTACLFKRTGFPGHRACERSHHRDAAVLDRLIVLVEGHHRQCLRCRCGAYDASLSLRLEIDAESEERPVNSRLQAQDSLAHRVTDLEMQQGVAEAQAEVLGESPVELGIRRVRHIRPNSKPAAITVQVEPPFLPKVLPIGQSDQGIPEGRASAHFRIVEEFC